MPGAKQLQRAAGTGPWAPQTGNRGRNRTGLSLATPGPPRLLQLQQQPRPGARHRGKRASWAGDPCAARSPFQLPSRSRALSSGIQPRPARRWASGRGRLGIAVASGKALRACTDPTQPLQGCRKRWVPRAPARLPTFAALVNTAPGLGGASARLPISQSMVTRQGSRWPRL